VHDGRGEDVVVEEGRGEVGAVGGAKTVDEVRNGERGGCRCEEGRVGSRLVACHDAVGCSVSLGSCLRQHGRSIEEKRRRRSKREKSDTQWTM